MIYHYPSDDCNFTDLPRFLEMGADVCCRKNGASALLLWPCPNQKKQPKCAFSMENEKMELLFFFPNFRYGLYGY